MADLLIVDDDADSLEALAEVMRIAGHEVRVAYNGEEGLHRLAERHPDLILLDVEMPVLSGPEMAYRMLVHNAGQEKVPIVLISGVSDLPEVAREVGTPYCLPKPYRFETLEALVNRALRERKAPTPASFTHGR